MAPPHLLVKHFGDGAGLTPWVQNSAEREQHGRITKRGPNELRTALVQVVLGLVRNKRRTDAYRIAERYDRIKRAKGGLGAQYHRNGSGAE